MKLKNRYLTFSIIFFLLGTFAIIYKYMLEVYDSPGVWVISLIRLFAIIGSGCYLGFYLRIIKEEKK